MVLRHWTVPYVVNTVNTCARPGYKFHKRTETVNCGFSRVSPLWNSPLWVSVEFKLISFLPILHLWENVHGCQHYCCGCKVANFPNILRIIISDFFWPIYLFNTELKEEWMNETAKCHKNLHLKTCIVKKEQTGWTIKISPWASSFGLV